MISEQILQLAKQVNALADIGLVYKKDEYDEDRYNELKKISLEMMSLLTNQPIEAISTVLPVSDQYVTPKVDVRGVVFDGKDRLLMVREKIDGKWSMPGGWADVGYTPSEIAVKETAEEAGIQVKSGRLLAVMDKKCHDHPSDIHYVYKIFILCEIVHFDLERGYETDAVDFFSISELPPLSEPRNTKNQIEILYDLYKHPEKLPYLD